MIFSFYLNAFGEGYHFAWMDSSTVEYENKVLVYIFFNRTVI